MIWLTWRQHRKQALFAIVGLAVVAALILPTGRQMNQVYHDTGLAECARTMGDAEFIPVDASDTDRCIGLANSFTDRFGALGPLAFLFAFLPLFVGLFFGAPLVAREVEHGTHRLVWTQGVTRLRWSLVKFGLVGAGTLALAAAYAALLTWWVTPLNRATGLRFSPLAFDLQGLVPVAYTVFAVALGIFAGTVVRRVLPAMAVTLVGFIGVRLAVTLVVRSRFVEPERRTYPLASDKVPNEMTGDWVFGRGVYRADGTLVQADSRVICRPPPDAAGQPPLPDVGCAKYGAGAYNQEIYQPADRFWLFQYIEAGLFIALAAVLLALAIHQVRRRIS